MPDCRIPPQCVAVRPRLADAICEELVPPQSVRFWNPVVETLKSHLKSEFEHLLTVPCRVPAQASIATSASQLLRIAIRLSSHSLNQSSSLISVALDGRPSTPRS